MTMQRLCGHKKNPRIWGIGLMFSHALLPLLETKLRSGTMGIFFNFVCYIVWAQEEPKSMGYWTYVQPRLFTSVGNKVKVRYNGHI